MLEKIKGAIIPSIIYMLVMIVAFWMMWVEANSPIEGLMRVDIDVCTRMCEPDKFIEQTMDGKCVCEGDGK